MKKKVALTLVAFVIVCGVLIAFMTADFNRSHPAGEEYALANSLIKAIQPTLANNQKVYFEAGNQQVYLNVYGATDKPKQDNVISAIKETLSSTKNSIKVVVTFYSERREIQTKDNKTGLMITNIEKGKIIRSESLN